MDWANMVIKLRNKMLLTQTELASLLGVSFGTVNRWENGKHDPTMKQKRALMKLIKENNVGVND